jgi:hypothetical protein
MGEPAKFIGEGCLIRGLQQTGPQCTVHLEHGVHHLLGNPLDLFLRLIPCVFPSRSWRLRGEPSNLLDCILHAPVMASFARIPNSNLLKLFFRLALAPRVSSRHTPGADATGLA